MSQYLPLPDFYASLFVAVLVLVFLLFVLVLAAVTFVDTERGQRMMRDHLGKRLAGSRMWSMLEHRGVAPLAYIDHHTPGELRLQLRRCEDCARQDLCDETLGYSGARKRNYGFCANRKAIDAFASMQPGGTQH